MIGGGGGGGGGGGSQYNVAAVRMCNPPFTKENLELASTGYNMV